MRRFQLARYDCRLVVWLALACACAGRKPYPPGGEVCPTSGPAEALFACVEAVGTDNAMPRNAMPRNGISVASLTTNHELLKLIAGHALESARIEDHAHLLNAPYARDLMRYVVSCALDPCAEVTVSDGAGGVSDSFPGLLGLCDGTYTQWASNNGLPKEDSWAERAATPGCLERVSSCVLARTNAVDARVLISMRGAGLDLGDNVPIETEYREHRGTPIRSFESCRSLCLWGDRLTRNCDWSPRFVGQCVGGSVRLRVADGAPTRVRVCAGIHGCDDFQVNAGGVTDSQSRTYGGVLLAQDYNRVEFTCPENGPEVSSGASGEGLARSGYYSVMLAPAQPGAALPVARDVTAEHLGGRGTYPADEASVFTYREGAFYGNIFNWPEGAANAQCAGPEALSLDQHACFSDMWSEGEAYLSHRLCAGSTASLPGGCFAAPPGPCDGGENARCGDRRPVGRRAGGATDATIGAYSRCAGGDKKWRHAYTVYLNHPCDLTSDRAACLRALDKRVIEEMAPALDPRDLRRDFDSDGNSNRKSNNDSDIGDLFE